MEARYAVKTVCNKLSILGEKFSETCNPGNDLSDFIGDMETSFAKLENTSKQCDNIIQQ